MPRSAPPEARQLQQLLQEKLIPWMSAGAPLILFDTPPRGPGGETFRAESTPPLSPSPVKKAYPHVQVWPDESLNSIDVPVLGCLFAGQADYRVRRPPGEEGAQWTVSLQAGSFFLVPPGVPFTRGWCRSRENYARGFLVHLRRDSVRCFTYTMDGERVWQSPYVILHELEAQLPAGRLLGELRRARISPRIVSHYAALILELMARAFQEGRCTSARRVASTPQQYEPVAASPPLHDWMRYAEEYIREHLHDPALSCRRIALHTGVSERHLERLFKQKTGLAPFQFVQRQRLEKARMLLRAPGLPIHQVAFHCGFRRASHFSAWFARHNQCAPRDYRRKRQRNA